MLRIGRQLSHPFAQHVLVQIQVTCRLTDRYATVLDQPHRLTLELAAERSSRCHEPPPVSSSHLNSVSVKPAAVHIDITDIVIAPDRPTDLAMAGPVGDLGRIGCSQTHPRGMYSDQSAHPFIQLFGIGKECGLLVVDYFPVLVLLEIGRPRRPK